MPSWGLHGAAAFDLAVTSGLRSGAIAASAGDGTTCRLVRGGNLYSGDKTVPGYTLGLRLGLYLGNLLSVQKNLLSVQKNSTCVEPISHVHQIRAKMLPEAGLNCNLTNVAIAKKTLCVEPGPRVNKICAEMFPEAASASHINTIEYPSRFLRTIKAIGAADPCWTAP